MLLKLPFPPSVNHYYVHKPTRSRSGKLYTTKVISKNGSVFRNEVMIAFRLSKFEPFGEERLSMSVDCHCPTRRKYDLDNLGKALQDALQVAGVFPDDSQLDELHFYRKSVEKGGYVLVTLEAI